VALEIEHSLQSNPCGLHVPNEFHHVDSKSESSYSCGLWVALKLFRWTLS